MIDMLLGMLAPKARPLTATEIDAVIDQFAPLELADIFDSRVEMAHTPAGLDLVSGQAAQALFNRCGPIIDEIARLATGKTDDEIRATGFIVKAAIARDALLATFPGLPFEQAFHSLVHLAIQRTAKTSGVLSNTVQRH